MVCCDARVYRVSLPNMEIRNYCIVAHIDHGKSTLADRFLELTGTVDKRHMKEQMLDQMDLEREKGITIKLQPVRMVWKNHVLNLIDTPGHVDFQYEVSRSLKAVEGAILLVDATQGVQAQTVSNMHLAQAQHLTIIPVINKIDLPAANIEGVKRELVGLLHVLEKDIHTISAKTGEGVSELLDEIVKTIPPPSTGGETLRALIFDSTYDDYKGVVAYVRVVDGSVSRGKEIRFLGTGVSDTVVEVGTFAPQYKKGEALSAGEIGYIATGLKDIHYARVGDTITLTNLQQQVEPLPGFAIPQPKVFAGIYPSKGEDFPRLREGVEKLQLNDASLTSHQETNTALGQGYRCGFLGLLHLEIVQERLKREFDLNIVVTTPSVLYKVSTTSGTTVDVHTPSEFPDPSSIMSVKEQYCKAELIVPTRYIGSVFEVIKRHEGTLVNQVHVGTDRVLLTCTLPLRELIIDLYDQLKSVTAGYGSLSYGLVDWQGAHVVKMSILINHEPVEALSTIVPQAKLKHIARRSVEQLKSVVPKQLFSVPIQAAVGGTIVARETLPALRKDVTGYLYGGDVTRKRKLLEKQKRGKKRLASGGSVELPPEAYIAMLRR